MYSFSTFQGFRHEFRAMLGLQRGERGSAVVGSGGKKGGRGEAEGKLPLSPKMATPTGDTVLVKPNLETDL